MRQTSEHKENSQNPVILYGDEPAKPRGKVASAVMTALAPFTFTFRFLRKYTNLTVWIVISMIIGVLVGNFAPSFAVQIAPLGTLFIRMIQTIVVSTAVLLGTCVGMNRRNPQRKLLTLTSLQLSPSRNNRAH